MPTQSDPELILEGRLWTAERQGLGRTLSFAQGLDLSSNDILGFATDSLIRDRLKASLPTENGSMSSRLLRGNLAVICEAEKTLAQWAGREQALIFGSGYQAALALGSAFLYPGDIAYTDELIHASWIDAVRLSKSERRVFEHNSVESLERLLAQDASAPGLKWIITESVFSMDGDLAPLSEIADLAKKYRALLWVDEAHATGLYGARGGGRVQALGLESKVFATLHTGGKALGVGGAVIAGSELVTRSIINFSRPFIFSTGVIPALARSLQIATERWSEVGEVRAGLVLRSAERLRLELRKVWIKPSDPRVLGDGAPMVPIVLGSSTRALQWSRRLQEAGFDVRAVRPPTVKEGTARLRVTVTYEAVESGRMDHLLATLIQLGMDEL